MESEDTFFNFVNNHNNYFKKYNDIEELKYDINTGWLYIFTALQYDNDLSKQLPQNTDKLGKTISTLFKKFLLYDIKVFNIESIQCSLSDKRERLLKAFIRLRIKIKPIIGQEYFVGIRNLIKILMLIIVFIPDNNIILYEKYYDEDDLKYNELFDIIEVYLNRIKNNENFELKIEQQKVDQKIVQNINQIEEQKLLYEKIDEQTYICNFCKKVYKCISALNHHQKTAKFCIQMQNRELKKEEKFIFIYLLLCFYEKT